MASARTLAAAVASVAFLLGPPQAQARGAGFLQQQREGAGGVWSDVRGAIDAALSRSNAWHKHRSSEGARLAELEGALAATWRSLPKNGAGLLEAQTLRLVVRRHFSRASALVVRGFEPSQQYWPQAAGRAGGAGAFGDGALEQLGGALASGQAASPRGFSARDAALVVLLVERLVSDQEEALLEEAYENCSLSPHGRIGRAQLQTALEHYLVQWMMGSDRETANALLANRSILESGFPHWAALADLLRGSVRALDFRRQRAMQPGALRAEYSFQEARAIVAGITRSFASFWDDECRVMKEGLVKMDTYRTGRVPLSKFYGAGLDTEWRYGESEAYLRGLGVLDESSRWLGKQVIITNYMHGESNCIVSGSHYKVCCMDDCEGLLGEIEAAAGSPALDPLELLELVENVAAPTLAADDGTPALPRALAAQLRSIAAAHGGVVPLHGRLFARWLHLAFPHHCPLPPPAASHAARPVASFSDEQMATREEMLQHAGAAAAAADEAENATAAAAGSELHLMSHWSVSSRPTRARRAPRGAVGPPAARPAWCCCWH
ncbi:unnamed protein product [Prorocentrum cordatum]|uniref:Selenoprotein O n=1 Tax=Prorocentrum cordatum TaxID=2364126 RepID=A0ABN9TD18_9DINO|nr:unnamed protein product [Polarella glacialis]